MAKPVPITFTHSVQNALSALHQTAVPLVSVDVFPPGANTTTSQLYLPFLGLLDTGSDHLVLPDYTATALGLPAAAATAYQIHTAGGTVIVDSYMVTIRLEGVTLPNPVQAFVNPQQNIGVLVGRHTLLAYFDTVGLDSGQWLGRVPGTTGTSGSGSAAKAASSFTPSPSAGPTVHFGEDTVQVGDHELDVHFDE